MQSNFTKILRWVLALCLIVFGLNKFIGFLPVPELPPAAQEFMSSLSSTGYILYLIGLMELVIATLLLLKKWVPFALLALVPISTNILLFHIFLDLPNILQAILVSGINAVLIYKYWKAYRPLFH